MRVPNTSTSPDVASRIPASTLSSVVFPQPEGPTSSSNSPVCTLKSTLSSACTSVVPTPNNFVTPRRHAACVPFSVSQLLTFISTKPLTLSSLAQRSRRTCFPQPKQEKGCPSLTQSGWESTNLTRTRGTHAHPLPTKHHRR